MNIWDKAFIIEGTMASLIIELLNKFNNHATGIGYICLILTYMLAVLIKKFEK